MRLSLPVRLTTVVLATASLAVAGCGSSKTASTSATTAPPKAEVTVSDAWARQTAAGATMGAAYMTLTATVDDSLLSASVPTSVAAKTELHETVAASTDTTATGGSSGGMESTTTTGMGDSTTSMTGSGEMTMRPVSSIALPAGQAVALKPGGYHIMLIDLAAPLTAGQQVTITLTFAQAGTQQVTATVREG